MFYTSSEWPSEVSSGHQCSSGAAAALHEFGVAAAARCVVRRVEPLVPTAAAHSRRRRPIALPLDLPLDLPHGHQRDDLLPLRGATARLRAERMRGASVTISRNQSQSAAISRNQPQSDAINRNLSRVHAGRQARLQASRACLTRIASRKTACLYWSSVWSSVRCRMYERIETTNAPAQQVNPRYAHSAKGGPRRAAASAEKGICLMRDAIRGHHQRSSHTSEKGICLRAERRRGQSVSINRTRAGGVGREWHSSMPELAVINRYQSPSNRPQIGIHRH